MDNGALVRRRPRYDRIVLKQNPSEEGLCFFVMFGLEPDISAGWSGNDNKKRKHENDNIIFLMLDF